MKLNTLFLTACLALCAQQTQAAGASSQFDTGPEGWTVAGDATPPRWFAPGYIEATDLGNGQSWYWNAPSQFLGNQLGAISLSFSLQATPPAPGSRTNWDVVLIGAGRVLAMDLPAYPNDTSWAGYNINFAAGNWSVIASNPSQGLVTPLALRTATPADMQSVMSHLDQLYIRGEYSTNIDTGRLDNVVLAAVPEPETWAMLLAGLSLVAAVKQRRRPT